MNLVLLAKNLDIIELQGFSWDVLKISSSLLHIKLSFTNPEVISYYMIDTVQVKFMNTLYFLKPIQGDLQPTIKAEIAKPKGQSTHRTVLDS